MLAGRVNVTNHILTWTAPSSGITRYQLQSKDPARGGWHFPSGGSATPSSLSATTLTWSIVTPASLVRHYRVRATNDDGDGPWSGVVALTSASPPPPPLSAPDIPNFSNLPSGGRVNTPFPAATGGRPPYRYSLSGLPPGITFNPATRVASGTLPTVSRTTTWRITYTVTDNAGATDSDTFTATVVPP